MTQIPHQANQATPARLTIVAWADPRTEVAGHKPGSPYVEATRSKQIFELSECLPVEGRVDA